MPFASIVGHTPIVALLRHAVAVGRVPQSLLLAGPEGVGKRTTAVALAQAVNCPKRRDGDACGVCPTCRRIARGQHSDVTLVDRGDEASLKIKVLRERVLDVVGYRPFEAERRVFVIDQADDLTMEAQDALLKTLEEPPAATIVVLVTAYPDTLAATVQSRCRRLRFGPLSESDVARVLIERCGIAHADARVLAAASGGSVGRALAEQAGDLADDRDAALALLTIAAKGRGVGGRLKAAIDLAQHGSKRRDRDALGTRLALLGSLLRDLAALGARQTDDALANSDLTETLVKLQPAFDLRRAVAGFSAISRAQQALDRNASPKIVADWVALAV
jgi:DNA polymerase-3 subunit delta'